MKLRDAMALHQAGRIAEANAAYRKLVARTPADALAQHMLGVTFLQLGDPAAAAASITRALRLKPDDPGAHNNLGLALQGTGELAGALEHYRAAIRIDPGFAFAHCNLGSALRVAGEPAAAVAACQQALALDPDYDDARFHLGNALFALGRFDAAADCFRQVLARQPGRPEVLFNLGNALIAQERPAEAAECYRQALAHAPDDPEILVNLGNALAAQHRHDEAAGRFQAAIAADPGRAEAHQNLGNALAALGRYGEAEAALRRSLELRPDNAEAANSLGTVLLAARRRTEAREWFRRAVALDPNHLHARTQCLHLDRQAAVWRPGEEAALLDLVTRATPGPGTVSAFPFLHFVAGGAAQRAIATLQARGIVPAAVSTPAPQPSPPGTPVRVGYFSGDFGDHPVSFLTAELYELHDRTRCVPVLLSYGPDDGSTLRQRIAAAAPFIDLRGLAAPALRERIGAERLDVLVDLAGYTAGSLTALLSPRLAPVQVIWMGYPGTSGADFMDYIVGDAYVIPTGAEAYYSEKVIRLPEIFQPNDRHRAVAEPLRRESYGLPPTATVLCCFCQTAKLNADLFAAWMHVLGEVPGTVLWLVGGEETTANLRGRAVALGVDPDRLVFAPVLPYPEHLARYRVADLALDTFPFGSGTTASDALWAGCPLVALSGEAYASRMAGALLTAAGLRELIADDLATYTRLVTALAADRARLADLRARLARTHASGPLFDTPRFVRHFETALIAAVDRARAGLPPADITVTP